MRDLKFHYVKAVNILCFGPEGIEIDFGDYDNVVHIKGINLDNPGTNDVPASNGSGKSSLQELLSIALYGRTVKSPTKLKGGKFLNVLADKGTIELQWDNFRVIRTFRRSKTGITSKVQVWESADRIWDDNSETNKTQGADETQRWIEKKVGLNHNAFCNVVVFDDSDKYSFLDMDTPTKREFVENLLGLDQYRQYHENAKDYLKEQKRFVENLGREYQTLQDEVVACDRRIATIQQQEKAWRATKEKELQALHTAYKAKEQELMHTNVGELLAAWQQAQERIVVVNEEVTNQEAKRTKALELIKMAREKLDAIRGSRDAINEVIQSHHLEAHAANNELQQHLGLIKKLEGLHDGARCPVCYGIISAENYSNVLQHSRNAADGCRSKINTHAATVDVEKKKFGEKSASITTIETRIQEAESKRLKTDATIRQLRQEVADLSRISKPEAGNVEKILEAEIVQLRKQLKEKKEEAEGESPYATILTQAEQEKVNKVNSVEVKAKELEGAEKEIPYYEYWVHAFGDKGIRKYVIDGVIPALNTRTAHWLRYLIDNKIDVTFDNELEETITRNGNAAHFEAMSKGERRKINLAVSQAWAYIRMLNAGSCPNLVFLDEITGGGIDHASMFGIYNMVFELAKERQVFVTTHNENLLNMLQGCQTIQLKKENDLTVLVS